MFCTRQKVLLMLKQISLPVLAYLDIREYNLISSGRSRGFKYSIAVDAMLLDPCNESSGFTEA